ncbi:hypothetical protein M422DRAFT_248496 [Sphaerobolus stellatus SS14]|uniref:N-acetyltransferase domain-containing protein n=1 Tax=Sphaerobolus stellatus (strain SS14) TaxID=990650 RepID=A0A0C9W4Q4_SPHS4|nr:hypothetical protein M422DRAFT_248496 [Sphaerobolus stellatus SS14]
MSPNLPQDLFFDYVTADEVGLAHEIEQKAFPPEEVGSLEAFKKRQAVAPKLFLGAFTAPRTLIGYANATLANSSTLTHESMSEHDANGTSVCIHSLAVIASFRRRGVATALMEEYIRQLREDPQVGGAVVERILLICHENLMKLYEGVGFVLKGRSSVVHGPDPWFEMGIDLADSVPPYPETLQQAAHSSIPPNILAALTSSSRNRPTARPYASFGSSELVSAEGENAFDILCPRSGCGSIILKAGAGKLRKGPSFELEPTDRTPPAPLERLPSPPTEISWWLVTPSPMAFENIGFSRPINSSTGPSEPKIKLLACAECDLGAFGWSKEGGTEFWLAASRVGYRE